jgi:hypothetical protein
VRQDWTEEQLEFDFSGARRVDRPEEIERHLRVVDFVVRYPNETWLIECKDPEAAPLSHRPGAIRGLLAELTTDVLLKKHLLPKLYGTFAFYCLMGSWIKDKSVTS